MNLALTPTQANILFIVLIILLLAANVYFRKRKSDKTPLGMVVNLLSDIKKNQKLAELFNPHWQSKKFRTKSWQNNQDKVDFLPQELRNTLLVAFSNVESINQKLDEAKRHKSDIYLASVDIEGLKPPLSKARQELVDWLRENISNPAYYPKRRGLFDGLFRR